LAKGNPVVLAGLDLGTSKTAVAIAAVNNASLEILGVGESPSIGVQKGIVTDTESAARSVKQALEKAEKMAGLKIDSAYLSYNGASIQIRNCRIENTAGNIPANSAGDKKITGLLETPVVAGIPPDEDPLQILSTRIGLTGFGCEARVITAGSRDLAQLTQSVRLAGLEPKGIIYGPLAAAEVLLTPAERELGAILVDIGAGQTSVSIFDRCMLKETAVFPLAGEHLASDLAIGLRISLGQAREILWGGSLATGVDQTALQDLAAEPAGPGAGESREHLVRSIIEARAEEIIDVIDETIKSFNYPGALPGGVILSGGVSGLDGLVLIAEKKLHKPVKIGPQPQGGIVLRPACAGALGLVRYVFKNFTLERKNFSKSGLKESAAKILGWLQVQLNDYKAGQSKNQ
jgi:cell division protein FtsA